MKPGYKTTEFWLSLAAMVIGTLTASGAFASEGIVMKIVGVIGTILAALGYTAVRGAGKKADALTAAASALNPPSPPPANSSKR